MPIPIWGNSGLLCLCSVSLRCSPCICARGSHSIPVVSYQVLLVCPFEGVDRLNLLLPVAVGCGVDKTSTNTGYYNDTLVGAVGQFVGRVPHFRLMRLEALLVCFAEGFDGALSWRVVAVVYPVGIGFGLCLDFFCCHFLRDFPVKVMSFVSPRRRSTVRSPYFAVRSPMLMFVVMMSIFPLRSALSTSSLKA